MFEKKLYNLIEESRIIRQKNIENNINIYHQEFFYGLSNFILKKLSNPLFKNKNAKIIADNFDKILPYIVMSNIDILFLHADLLIEQPNFKDKFVEGLKKYPYPTEVYELIRNISSCFYENNNKFDNFIDSKILDGLASLDLNSISYIYLFDRLNYEKQGDFLRLLINNKCDFPLKIDYKGDNKKIIYDNLDYFINNHKNIFELLDLVKENSYYYSKVKEYIDNNKEKVINSIFENISYNMLNNPKIKEIVKLIILDVLKNENIKLSNITFDKGSFSQVLLIGDKVIKLGNRATKEIKSNPYIIKPLLRREIKIDGETCFIEVTERVETNIDKNEEELYKLFKNLRDLGLVWTDVEYRNVGRLKKKNIIHWQEKLEPSDKTLCLRENSCKKILEEGSLVILDADFIYEENDPNLLVLNSCDLYKKFEKRYKKEKNMKSNIVINNYPTYKLEGSKIK